MSLEVVHRERRNAFFDGMTAIGSAAAAAAATSSVVLSLYGLSRRK